MRHTPAKTEDNHLQAALRATKLTARAKQLFFDEPMLESAAVRTANFLGPFPGRERDLVEECLLAAFEGYEAACHSSADAYAAFIEGLMAGAPELFRRRIAVEHTGELIAWVPLEVSIPEWLGGRVFEIINEPPAFTVDDAFAKVLLAARVLHPADAAMLAAAEAQAPAAAAKAA